MNLPKTRKEYEVWQACDDLLASGKTVREITGEAIGMRLRELHYKAGSSNERYKYRDTWMAARGLSREEQYKEATESNDPIARAAAVFREGLERELRREYEKKYQEFEAKIEVQQTLLNQKETQLQEVQQQLAEITETHQKLHTRYQLQSENWQTLQEESLSQKMLITQLEKQSADAQTLYQTHLAQLQALVEERRKENEQQRLQLEKNYKTAIAELKEAAEAQRHLLIVELDSVKMAVKRVQHELSKKQEAYLTLQQQHSELQGRFSQLFTTYEEYQQEQTRQHVQEQDTFERHVRALEKLAQQHVFWETKFQSLMDLPRDMHKLQQQVHNLLTEVVDE